MQKMLLVQQFALQLMVFLFAELLSFSRKSRVVSGTLPKTPQVLNQETLLHRTGI
jgi:hypothetical protein